MPQAENRFDSAAAKLIAGYIADPNPSARVLISTIFGDSLGARGGPFWLGSIARLLEPFDINERLVRTSMRRLISEEMLTSTQVGRRSFYGIHPAAVGVFADADHRIYHRTSTRWNQKWTLTVLDPTSGTTAERHRLRRELVWLGLGSLSSNVLVSPSVPADMVGARVADSAAGAGTLIAEVTVCAFGSAMTDKSLAGKVAPLASLAASYSALIDRYQPILDAIHTTHEPLHAERAFLVRVLLITDYRRIIHTDPELPSELLPSPWIGDEAHQLTAKLYHSLLKASDTHLTDMMQTPAGSVDLSATARTRFSQYLA